MTGPSVEVLGVTKRFGNFTAVDALTLRLEGAKCVGFLGPNGAGKTTTLKMLTDMIFPSAGECRVNGVSVQEDRVRALSDAGVLIETPEIYPALTPRQAFEMIADLRGVPAAEINARTEEALAEVKMADWADRRVGKFSKGMKQRVNIAAALIHDPNVLILDEPATGLDPRGMAEVREIVRGLKKRRRLVFLSSHILQEVVDVCDEVALIDKGKLLFYDTLENVTSKFADGNPSFDVGLARPLANEAAVNDVAALPGVTSATILEPRRLRIRFHGGPEGQEKLLEALVSMRIGVTSFSEPVSALEDIYLKQISRGD